MAGQKTARMELLCHSRLWQHETDVTPGSRSRRHSSEMKPTDIIISLCQMIADILTSILSSGNLFPKCTLYTRMKLHLIKYVRNE